MVRGLEAAKKLVEGVQDLLCQALAHLVLVLAALFEERRQALVAQQVEEPNLAEKEAQGARDRPAGGREHVGDVEVQPPRGLAPGRRDEAQRPAVEEQPRRDACLAEEPLHAAVGRGFEMALAANDAIGIFPRIEHLDEKLPGRGAVSGVALAHREVGPQRLAPVGKRRLQVGGDRALGCAGVELRIEAPFEDGLREGAEVGKVEDRTFLGIEGPLLAAGLKELLPFAVAAVQNRIRVIERRGGDDEPRRLDEAEPFEVRLDVRVGGAAGHQFVSGQR